MEKLDLVYRICEEWASDNCLDFIDVTKRPESRFYICEIDNSSLGMKELLELSLELNNKGLELYSIDRYRSDEYFEIWII